MKTNTLLIGLLVSALAGACSDNESEAPEGAAGAAGDRHAAAGGEAGEDHSGGHAGDDQKATGGEAGARQKATGGIPGDDDDDAGAGGSAGAGGVPSSTTAGAGPGGSAGEAGDHGGGTYGFSIRAPRERELTCSENPTGSTGPELLMDEDFVCTFAADSVDGYVYVQGTPTDCRVLMGATPSTFDATAWISVGGDVSELDGALYDHGGNHFNNTIEFDYGDQHYRIDHSSIGYGGRSCQQPDCVQVFERDRTTLVEDGCTQERTLPVTCVAIEAAGAVPSLQDTFAPCPGDPNYSDEAQG